MGVPAYPARVAICHKNIKHMLSQFTNLMGEENHNIANMTNKSREMYAYTLMDLDKKPDEETIQKLSGIGGILRVRVIQ